MKFVFALAVACAISTAAGYAQRPDATAADPKGPDIVAVRGCLRGRTLVADTGTGASNAQRYDLTGDKQTLKALKAHSGHMEEVTGKLVDPRNAAGATRGAEKRWGKNRVYAGNGTATINEPRQIASGPVIEVKSFKHLADGCS